MKKQEILEELRKMEAKMTELYQKLDEAEEEEEIPMLEGFVDRKMYIDQERFTIEVIGTREDGSKVCLFRKNLNKPNISDYFFI